MTDLHLMVTSLCDRNCKYCCNKQYDLNDIPYVTDKELRSVEDVYITGGEPFLYSNPSRIAYRLKMDYWNIGKVIVYTNAHELFRCLKIYGANNLLAHIDGLTISVKAPIDQVCFERFLSRDDAVTSLKSNRLYVFPKYENTVCPASFTKIKREWQENFKPAPNCIFRRL